MTRPENIRILQQWGKPFTQEVTPYMNRRDRRRIAALRRAQAKDKDQSAYSTEHKDLIFQ